MYYTSNDCDYFGVDANDYKLFDENYELFDEDYEDYDYDDDDDNDYYDFYDKLYYRKPFNHFERLVSVKNNIENATSNDDYSQNITLIVNNRRIYIS